MARSSLADRLADLRREAGLSQPALGAAIGMSTQQIRRVEHGKRRTDGVLVGRWLGACGAADRWDEVARLLPAVLVLS